MFKYGKNHENKIQDFNLNDPVDRSLQLRDQEPDPGQEVDRSGNGQLLDALFAEMLNSDPLGVRFRVTGERNEGTKLLYFCLTETLLSFFESKAPKATISC